jgi:hypothetical protein
MVDFLERELEITRQREEHLRGIGQSSSAEANLSRIHWPLLGVMAKKEDIQRRLAALDRKG